MRRGEYPRPDFRRKDWQSLDGIWNFDFDDANTGLEEKWYLNHEYKCNIKVPFVYQSKLSGIESEQYHEVVWYNRKFNVKLDEHKQLLLHFGAVDYQANIWVNGQFVGSHNGGNTSFTIIVPNGILKLENTIVVRVYDPQEDETISRGKQNWTGMNDSVWYSNSTGIWQPVWMEQVSQSRIDKVRFYPDIDRGMVSIQGELTLPKNRKYTLTIQILKNGVEISTVNLVVKDRNFKFDVDLFQNHIFRTMFHDSGWTWTPDNPVLFDCVLVLQDDKMETDKVDCYFGMREIRSENGKILLNNIPLFQKLVLNQGIWKDGLYTAPTDSDFKTDILSAKKMGFNGCRMHQKVEDPRFLYWADKLGFLVWGECASSQVFTEDVIKRKSEEWIEIINRDFNHPSIITWVPFNESWGVPQIHRDLQQQNFTVALYYLIHSLDKTRLVDTTDGWEQTKTDICGIHNYSHGDQQDVDQYEKFKSTLLNKENMLNISSNKWQVFAQGYFYHEQPMILTECGGISFNLKYSKNSWGYSSVETSELFIEEYKKIIMAIKSSECLVGFCYTQLCDVQQETNGLLETNRHPKVNPDEIKMINDLL